MGTDHQIGEHQLLIPWQRIGAAYRAPVRSIREPGDALAGLHASETKPLSRLVLTFPR
jgi:hypothetical protein